MKRSAEQTTEAVRSAARAYVDRHGRWPILAALDLEFWQWPGDHVIVQELVIRHRYQRGNFEQPRRIDHVVQLERAYDLGESVVALKHLVHAESWHIFNVAR